MPDGRARWYFCTAKSDMNGTVIVELALHGHYAASQSDRGQYLGLIAIAVVEQDNVEDRLTMMENIRN